MADDVVRTRRFELLDTQGRVRAVLACDDRNGAPSLAFLDGSGVTRAIVGISWNDMPQIQLSDADGAARVALVARPEGTGMVIVTDGDVSRSITPGDG